MAIHSVEPYLPGAGDGLPGTLTLPGSGLAVPAGLEAVFEYNGLYLNIHRNIDRYRVNGIDGLADADVRDARDVNTDDDGETPYSSFYGGRTISITGTIKTYSISKLRDMQMALKAAFADLSTEKPLRFMTGDITKDHIIYCKKIGSIAITEAQQNSRAERDFQVSLRASNPRFLSFLQNFVDVNPAPVGNLDFDVDMTDSDGDVDPVIATAVNRGNYSAQPVYRFYGPANQGVQITNAATAKQFVIYGPIPPGDYFEFNTAKNTLKDSSGDNQWNALDDDSDYVYLAPGSNKLIYDGDCSRITISWRDSWM